MMRYRIVHSESGEQYLLLPDEMRAVREHTSEVAGGSYKSYDLGHYRLSRASVRKIFKLKACSIGRERWTAKFIDDKLKIGCQTFDAANTIGITRWLGVAA